MKLSIIQTSKTLFLTVLFSFAVIITFAQDPSAIFELESTSQGVLVPRMSSGERTNITNPANGLLVYDNTENIFYFYDSNEWIPIKGAERLDSEIYPECVGDMPIGNFPRAPQKKGNYLYIPNEGNEKLEIVDVSDPVNPVLASDISLGFTPIHLDINGDFVFVTNQLGEYISVVNITDPLSPSLESQFNLTGSYVNPYNISVNASHAYVSMSGSDILKVIDISNPAALSFVTDFSLGAAPIQSELVGNILYLLTNNHELKVINITNPASPIIITSFPLSISGLSDIKVSDDYAYIISDANSQLEILDISNPSSPVSLNVHNHAEQYPIGLDIENNLLCVKFATSGLEIIDVSDPMNIVVEETFFPDSDGGIEVKDNHAYVPTYTGLKIYSIGNPIQTHALKPDGELTTGPWMQLDDNAFTYNKVVVGDQFADPSSILDLESSNKGLLIPRMTNAEIQAISNPASGLQVYSTDDNCLNVFNGDKWLQNCGSDISNNSSVPPVTQSWMQINDFDLGFFEGVSFVHNNEAYLMPGSSGQSHIYKYDQQSDTWNYTGNTLPTIDGIKRSVAFVVGNFAYIGTGEDNNSLWATDQIWEYDLINDGLYEIPGGFVDEREEAVAFAVGNYGYLGTGKDYNGQYQDDFYKFDRGSYTWSPISNYPGGAIQGGVSFTIGNYAYVGTGESAGNYLKTFFKYDPNTDSWTPIADFPGVGRIDAVAFVIEGEAYVGSGYDGFSTTSDFYKYDPNTDSWTQIDDAILSLSAGVGFSLESNGYIGTGNTGINSLYKLSPDHYSLQHNYNSEIEWVETNLENILSQGNDAGNHKITNVANPVSAQDAATKAYVDANDSVNDADSDPNNEIQDLVDVIQQGNSAGWNIITDVLPPVFYDDVATKGYVDSESEQSLSLNSPWTDYGGSFKGGVYYKDNGRVFLDGLINRGTAFVVNEVICTLPAAYAPAETIILSAFQQGSVFRVDVLTNGDVILRTTSGDVYHWLSLSGMNFSLK